MMSFESHMAKVMTAELGDRLRTLRETRALTQAELAERIGVARTSITNIEGGHQNLSVGRLFVLAMTLGVSVRIVFDPIERVGITAAALPSQDRDAWR
jgi:transcriptional regulator with XRE-family HTH domain